MTIAARDGELDLADWQLPAFPWPDLPVPDLPGATVHWAIVLPLLAAVLGLFATGRSSRAAAWVAVTGASLTAAVCLWQLYGRDEVDATRLVDTVGPVPFGELLMPWELSVDRLAAVIALVVAVVALVVQIFARWYLWFDPRYRVFAATVSLFTAAMLLVVHSADVVLTLVGWEVMGWCSFLLIGHLSTKDSANQAAGKALLVTRVADVGMVLGLVALATGAGTTSIPGILAHWGGPAAADQQGLLAWAMVGVVIGVAGKSALVPFQDWLPDAMEGPTPASALIHAATMVAAGTVVLAQLLPLLQTAGPARLLLAVLASVTVVVAALQAFAQPDLKRLLAWSTVGQVALMLAALVVVPVGTGPDAALMQLMSHAWFKALLFLTVGWLSVLTGSTLMTALSGGTRRYRSLRRPLALGLLALAGVPPTVGFVSKELVLAQSEQGVAAELGLSATLVLAAVGASVPLTAAYAMRAWLILTKGPKVDPRRSRRRAEVIDDFFDEPDVVREAAGIEEAESSISSSARAGISLLALLSLVGGVVAFTPLIQVSAPVNLQLLGASLLLMTAAALAVWAAARGVRSGDAAARLPSRVSLAAERGLYAETFYRAAVVRPTLTLARWVVRADHDVLDAYVRASGPAARLLGTAGSRTESSRPAPALLLVLAGVLVLGILAAVLT